MMELITYGLLITALINLVTADDVYQNSSDICTKCDCTWTNDRHSRTLNCRYEGFRYVLSNWPEHGQVLIALFSYNNITVLEKQPTSDAKVILVYDHCGIKEIRNSAFADVKNIDMLDLSSNSLTSEFITPNVFRGPYNGTIIEPLGLERLNLAYNQIHTLKKNLFSHMPKLRELNLEGNNFRIIDIHTQLAISSLTNLEVLNLANNGLTDLVDEAITGLNNLITIDLSSNEIDLIPESLNHVGDSLEKLIMDNNPVFELDGNSFLGLHNLIELSLNNLTLLTYVNANVFSHMKHLKVVKMSNNQLLNAINKDAFADNQTIIELYLNGNLLDHLDKDLLKWSTLRSLQMNGNRFYCSCDLYNITTQLYNQITKTEDGPTCVDPRNQNNVQIFRLKHDICDVKLQQGSRYRQIKQSFTLLRMTLVALSITVIVGTFAVIVISYAKWKRVKRNLSYPFVSQVTYNPLTTDYRF